MFPRFWFNWSIGSKIASLMGLLVLFTVASLTFLSIQREQKNFQQELTSRASFLLDTIPGTLRDQLYYMEPDELNDVARMVTKNESVTQFIIYDQSGSVLANPFHSGIDFPDETDPLGEKLIALSEDQVYTQWESDQLIAGKAIYLGNQVIGAVSTGFSTTSLDSKISELTRQSLFVALVILAIGSAFTFLFSRQITRTIGKLTRVTAKMAGGDLSIRVEIRAKDEIGQLSEAFNQMADSIQKRETELVELTGSLEQTVEKRTAELRERNLALERMASIDPLINCYNRRHFFDLARREFERSKRYDHPLSVMILDADYFKDINDTFGHLIGDQLLIQLAKFCQDHIRAIDIFARYGGEEFVVLMPETECQAAKKSAERLRELVAETQLLPGAVEISLNISIGVACWSGDHEVTFDTLLARADKALYHSKETGRNKVSSWSDV